MPEFTIIEEVHVTVEAVTAQAALDTFLNEGNACAKYFAVQEREVIDAKGAPCEVEDQ